MSVSGMIAEMILEMMEQTGGAEIQRNLLAQQVGCVPSQINYVIASRFPPELGYIVESRRGGGGYIRIRRVRMESGTALPQLLGHIGERIDETTCHAHIMNLADRDFIGGEAAALFRAATSDTALRGMNAATRDQLRAAVFKQLLLAMQDRLR
ncbi:MAG: CtsR family transcriptional regulator [Oscillospiraceae bacterium]|nr:CtsR family transcriptional regulator [Oscillospiraceae bacterium]